MINNHGPSGILRQEHLDNGMAIWLEPWAFPPMDGIAHASFENDELPEGLSAADIVRTT
jgi:hypothetical protein